LDSEQGSKNIRFHYSGYVIFAVQIFSVITGLIFTLLLTRNMNPNQFGIWTNIFDYIGYFTLFSGVFPFWAERFVARGRYNAVKTGTMAQLVTGLFFTVVYFPIIFFIYKDAIAPKIGAMSYLPIFLIAGTYIVSFYMIIAFEGLLQPRRPQALGYGLLIEEIVKVSLALVLILGFGQLFYGAVLSLVLSCFAQVGYYAWLLRKDFKVKTNWSYAKEWFKGSAAMAYNAVGGQLLSFVYILLFFLGGPDTRAYYQAATSFGVIISYAISLSIALYPRLLSNSCSREQVGSSFRTVMMLGIPLASINIAMSYSFLTVLNIAYGEAWPVLVALSFLTLFGLVSSFYNNCVMGVESFDAEGKISLRELVKSKVFKVFTLPYIQAAIALPSTFLALTQLPVAGSVQATLIVIIILIISQALTFSLLYRFMHREISIPVDWRSLGKYVLASAAVAVILFFTPTTTTLIPTAVKAIMGFLLYLALLLVIDKQARELLRQVWAEIKGNLHVLRGKPKLPQVENTALPFEKLAILRQDLRG
jgi:O-antigen/teichoic acid export membrane protein